MNKRNINIALTSIGRRGYLVDFFRTSLAHGDRILTGNSTPNAPGAANADVAFTIPPAQNDDYGSALLKIARSEKIDLLFSLHDWEVPAISAIKEQLAEAGTNAVVPDSLTCRICLDKYETYRWAQSKGIPTPRSWLTAHEALAEGSFPFVVKPRFGQGSVGVFKVESAEELDAALVLTKKVSTQFPDMLGISKDTPAILISEWIEGEEIGIDVVNDFEGDFAGVLAKKKIHSRGGETEIATTLPADDYAPIAKTISKALGHPGICDCDFIERDGTLFLIELNPRFGGLYPFAHLAGADVPKFLIELYRGNRQPELLEYHAGQTFTKHFSFSR